MLYLMVFTCCMIFLSYYTFDKDIFSPSFLLFIGYFISALATYYNTISWNVVITDKLILIMTTGWVAFFLAELFIRKAVYKEKRKGLPTQQLASINYTEINVSKIIMILFIGIDLIIFLLFYRDVARIAGGSSSLSNLVLNYKNNLSETGLSTIVQQTIKYIKGFAYVSAYVFSYNVFLPNAITRRIIKKNAIYLIPGIIYIAQCLLNGGRYTALAFIIGFVFMMYLLIQFRDNWKHKLKCKTLVIAITFVFAIFVLFWAIKELVGRTSTATLIEYITEYIGGPYELFSLYLESPPSSFCFESFAGIINSFNKLGLTDLPIRTYHEFRFSNTNILIGNVYTAFRSYYNDFGIIGVGSLSFIMSCVFNIAYHKLRFSMNLKKSAFLVVLYSSLLYTVVFNFFVDYFYARFSIGLIIEIFVMYVIYYLLVKKRLVLGRM